MFGGQTLFWWSGSWRRADNKGRSSWGVIHRCSLKTVVGEKTHVMATAFMIEGVAEVQLGIEMNTTVSSPCGRYCLLPTLGLQRYR